MKIRILVFLTIAVALTFLPLNLLAKTEPGRARKEDIPYIKCEVCKKLASQLHILVKNKQNDLSPKKVTEYEIIEIAENICNLKKQEADWITKIDIVEKGNRLELFEHDMEGQCNSECKTIELACQEVMDYHDTDVAEHIYRENPDIGSLIEYLCRNVTDACNKITPPVPKDRIPGEEFIPKSSKDVEMEKLLRSMEGLPGAPSMKMYSREDLMNMKNPGHEDEEDEEEDDNDENFKPDMGKVTRHAEENWKQKVTKGIKSATEFFKWHSKRLSTRIPQFWGGKKVNDKNARGNAEL